jgi:hypothetical protein
MKKEPMNRENAAKALIDFIKEAEGNKAPEEKNVYKELWEARMTLLERMDLAKEKLQKAPKEKRVAIINQIHEELLAIDEQAEIKLAENYKEEVL